MSDELTLNAAMERYKLAIIAEWQQSPEGRAWRDAAVAEYFSKLPPGDEGLCEVYVKANYPTGLPWSEYGPNWRARTSAGIAAVLDLQRRRDEEAGWLSPGKAAGLRTQLADRGSAIEKLRAELDERPQYVTVRDTETIDQLRAALAERDATIAELTRKLRDAGTFHGWTATASGCGTEWHVRELTERILNALHDVHDGYWVSWNLAATEQQDGAVEAIRAVLSGGKDEPWDTGGEGQITTRYEIIAPGRPWHHRRFAVPIGWDEDQVRREAEHIIRTEYLPMMDFEIREVEP